MGTDQVIQKIDKVSELTVDKLGIICDEEKVTVRSVCKLLYEGMNADIIKLDTEGKEFSRTADMPTRHKYMTSAIEVLRLVKKEVPQVNNVSITNINMTSDKLSRIETAIEEIGQLNDKIRDNPVYRGKVINVESAAVIR